MRVEYTQRIRNGEVKTRRLALGMSQRDLAEKINSSVTAISHIESFRSKCVSRVVIQQLADFFGVGTEVLYPRWLFEVAQVPTEVVVNMDVDRDGFSRLAQAASRHISCNDAPALELAIAEEEVAMLLQVYADLPKAHRTAVRLFSDGYSVQQIADKTGMSKIAAYKRMMAGLATNARMLPDLSKYSAQRIGNMLRYGLDKDVVLKPRRAPRVRRGFLRVRKGKEIKLPVHGTFTALVYDAVMTAGRPVKAREVADLVLAAGYQCSGLGRLRLSDKISNILVRDWRFERVGIGLYRIKSGT